MLTVHHLRISQSERISWLCEELQIPYEFKVYERDPVTKMAPASYKMLHPMQIAPVISDGDVVLAESGAIIDYILAKYGNGRLVVSPEDPAFSKYLFWFHFANGTFMPSEMVAALGKETRLAAFMEARLERAYAMMEDQLGKMNFLAGETFTAADIITFFPLTTMRTLTGRSISKYPNIRAYLARIGERPAYRAAMAKGDPDLTPLLW